MPTAKIPPAMLTLYQEAAATCPCLPWTVLAAIGTVESDNGQSALPGVHTGVNSVGAEGPMQGHCFSRTVGARPLLSHSVAKSDQPQHLAQVSSTHDWGMPFRSRHRTLGDTARGRSSSRWIDNSASATASDEVRQRPAE